jgi:hypothetical protein
METNPRIRAIDSRKRKLYTSAQLGAIPATLNVLPEHTAKLNILRPIFSPREEWALGYGEQFPCLPFAKEAMQVLQGAGVAFCVYVPDGISPVRTTHEEV